jgi:GNAT superfamily N-acetyltransferase
MRSRYAIESDGKTVAVAALMRLRSRYLVRMIGVVPEHQAKGYGSRLLREVCADADREGVALRLHVQEEPSVAISLLSAEQLADWYRRHGFRGSPGPRGMTRLPVSEAGRKCLRGC